MCARDFKPKIVLTGSDPDYGWLHLLLGAIVGIISTPLIWIALIFGVIYPLNDLIQQHQSSIPLLVWYGSWALTVLLLCIAFFSLRKSVPLFAGAFVFFAGLMSVPLLFFIWIGTLFP